MAVARGVAATGAAAAAHDGGKGGRGNVDGGAASFFPAEITGVDERGAGAMLDDEAGDPGGERATLVSGRVRVRSARKGCRTHFPDMARNPWQVGQVSAGRGA